MRLIKTYVIIIGLLAALGCTYAMVPYLSLKASIFTQGLNSRSIPVSTLIAERFDEPTMTVHLGRLSFAFPTRLAPEYATVRDVSLESFCIMGRQDVSFQICAPTSDGVPRYRQAVDGGDCLSGDAVELLTAAYRADARASSPGMSSEDCTRLRQLLEIRALQFSLAESVETFRRKSVKGVLTSAMSGNGHQVCILHYYSAREDVSGTATIIFDAPSPEHDRFVRALLTSIQIAS